MARYATRYYRTISPATCRWVLVEASDRILPEVGEDMGRYTVERAAQARHRRATSNTRLESVRRRSRRAVRRRGVRHRDARVDGGRQAATRCVGQTGLPLDEKGRLIGAAPTLQVDGVDDAWIAGDAAAVPDLANGPARATAPVAQHAVRQAKVLADNIVASLRGCSR